MARRSPRALRPIENAHAETCTSLGFEIGELACTGNCGGFECEYNPLPQTRGGLAAIVKASVDQRFTDVEVTPSDFDADGMPGVEWIGTGTKGGVKVALDVAARPTDPVGGVDPRLTLSVSPQR